MYDWDVTLIKTTFRSCQTCTTSTTLWEPSWTWCHSVLSSYQWRFVQYCVREGLQSLILTNDYPFYLVIFFWSFSVEISCHFSPPPLWTDTVWMFDNDTNRKRYDKYIHGLELRELCNIMYIYECDSMRVKCTAAIIVLYIMSIE